MASKPVTGVNQDTLWKAMHYVMRNPAECRLKVDGESVRDMKGHMQRTMRILVKPGSPTTTDARLEFYGRSLQGQPVE